MKPADFDRSLSALQQATPFRPFTVALINGDRIEVDTPGALVVRAGVAAYVSAGGLPVIFDHEGVTKITDDLMGQANF